MDQKPKVDVEALVKRCQCLSIFTPVQINRLVYVQTLRRTGYFREYPEYSQIRFTEEETRGAYEGPLTPDIKLKPETGQPLNAHLWE